MKRPPVTLVLAGLAAVVAVSDLVVMLQFLEVIPWGDDDLAFWGGRWAGVLMFGISGAIAVAVAFGWLMLKPWAYTVTMLMALIGLSVPVSALMANTTTWSTALLPIVLNAAVIVALFRPDVRQATKAQPAG
ncbi:MAG: hypothetical protein KF883_03330 [Thermomicrobiales bacterium]|nr:hypothetical protein [Thermomicrobiales bacterium]